MKILITGSAGFIGFYVTKSLLEREHTVIGIDNINDYYDPYLKFDRLNQLGIATVNAKIYHKEVKSSLYKSFSFYRMNLEDKHELKALFSNSNFDVVCNLAAQAGVRYSLENPESYIQSNIVGFLNILENCRHSKIKHLIYASSSSVYGQNSKIPFETTDRVDYPVSLYAATKKSNELMAHTYSHLYGFPTTGLRFFTVYGPWGRPDMAMFLFTDAILKGNSIKVFNNGDLERDFTYIDDITEGVIRVVEENLKVRKEKKQPYKIYNIGNSKSVKLMDFIHEIENALGLKSSMDMLPMQSGDVPRTWANTDDFVRDYGYKPSTTIDTGVKMFIKWYRSYYKR